jgi:hypothetical protein
MQKAAVAKTFIGARVSWVAYFNSTDEISEGEGIYWMRFRMAPSDRVMQEVDARFFAVRCTVPLIEFPDLAVLNVDDAVHITGDLSEVSEAGVSLTNAHLERA